MRTGNNIGPGKNPGFKKNFRTHGYGSESTCSPRTDSVHCVDWRITLWDIVYWVMPDGWRRSENDLVPGSIREIFI